jgi:hypothetical protein
MISHQFVPFFFDSTPAPSDRFRMGFSQESGCTTAASTSRESGIQDARYGFQEHCNPAASGPSAIQCSSYQRTKHSHQQFIRTNVQYHRLYTFTTTTFHYRLFSPSAQNWRGTWLFRSKMGSGNSSNVLLILLLNVYICFIVYLFLHSTKLENSQYNIGKKIYRYAWFRENKQLAA